MASRTSTTSIAQPAPAVRAPVAPALTFQPRSRMLLRKCACAAGSAGGCEDCRKKKKPLQRRASGPHSISHVPGIVHEVLAGAGRPLESRTRHDMESRFGHDFGSVRVHDDPRAAASARAVNAEAYTVGQDVVFDSGRYQPGTLAGRRLLAHELAHTIQQRGVQRSTGGIEAPAGVEEQRLEREADGLADRALHGPVAALPLFATSGGLRLSRQAGVSTGRSWIEVQSSAGKHQVMAVPKEDTVQGIQAFEVDELILPGSKGPFAKRLYDELAAGHGLQATVRFSAKKALEAGLWQVRAYPEQLRNRWGDRLHWPVQERNQLWSLAGGDAEFPKVGGKTCQMDHIVELQIGGNNTNENIQPLDAAQNASSGSRIKSQIFTLAQNIFAHPELSDGQANEVTLRFNKVRLDGETELVSDRPTAKPASPTCLGVARFAEFMPLPEGVRAAETGLEPYPLESGGARTALQVPIGWEKSAPPREVTIFGDPVNKAAGELIPGFLLTTLRASEKDHNVGGVIDTRDTTRLPITISDRRAAPVTFRVDRATHRLQLVEGRDAGIAFTYPYLSPGRITKLETEPATGLAFEGYIQSSVPLLGRFDVVYGKGEFRLKKAFDPASLRPPIPGARVTEATLGMQLAPVFRPEGNVAFEYAPGGKKLLAGSLTASADAGGFALDGRLQAYLPGIDNASGKIGYHAGAWTGGATIETGQLKNRFKYVKGGAVAVSFGEQGVVTTGRVDLDLPYAENVQLGLTLEKGKWLFTGQGTFNPPRLGATTIQLRYDGDHLIGDATPGPSAEILGIKGQLEHLHYEDGKFSGTGSASFHKGRAAGSLTLHLTPAGKFTGKGILSYGITESLVATGGAELDANEKLRLSGELKFAKPIELFKKFEARRTIFTLALNLPIPALSLGPIGAKALIEGSLDAAAGIGPGALHDTAINAAFDPLADRPDLDIRAASILRIPAYAEVTGAIRAGIKLDALLADAAAGLQLSVTARLDGGFETALALIFRNGRFTAEAKFELMLALLLVVALDAFVRAQAGIGRLSAERSKTWSLAGLKLDTGLKTGLRFPVRFVSDQPFQMPGLSDIEFIKPELDFKTLLERALAAAKSSQTGQNS